MALRGYFVKGLSLKGSFDFRHWDLGFLTRSESGSVIGSVTSA